MSTVETIEERIIREDQETIKLVLQSDAQEKENLKKEREFYIEQFEAQQEVEKAEAEYEQALKDELSAEDYAIFLKTDEQIDEQIMSEYNGWSGSKAGYIESVELTEREQQQAVYLAEVQKAKADLDTYINSGIEQQSLGLIKPDATFLELEQAGKNAIDGLLIQGEGTSNLLKQRDPSLSVNLQKHKELLKAHRKFQEKYKDDILNWRYSKPKWYTTPTGKEEFFAKEYRKEYDWFRAKDVHYFRRFYRIITREIGLGGSSDGTDEKSKKFRVYISYPGSNPIWSEASNGKGGFSDWLTIAEANSLIEWLTPLQANLETVLFSIDGTFESPYIAFPDQSPGKEVQGLYSFFKQKGFVQGRYNKTRAYEPCAKGYWFYETLPEEASQCVYMSGIMVDDEASYYPASIGLSYGIKESNDNLIVFPDISDKKIKKPVFVPQPQPEIFVIPEEEGPGGMFA